MTEQGSNLQQMIAHNVAGTKRGASKHTKRCLKLNGFAWKDCILPMKMPSKGKQHLQQLELIFCRQTHQLIQCLNDPDISTHQIASFMASEQVHF
jgi:hypothetical protein